MKRASRFAGSKEKYWCKTHQEFHCGPPWKDTLECEAEFWVGSKISDFSFPPTPNVIPGHQLDTVELTAFQRIGYRLVRGFSLMRRDQKE